MKKSESEKKLIDIHHYAKKILIIRNDNIGDLICSLPAFQLLRKSLPQAEIHLLANSYNIEIAKPLKERLFDRLIVYKKSKHVGLDFQHLKFLASFYFKLWRAHYDTVIAIGGGGADRFYRATLCNQIYSVRHTFKTSPPPLPHATHSLEGIWNHIASLVGSNELPPDEIDYPLKSYGEQIGFQISSRRKKQKWEVEKWIKLGKRLSQKTGKKIVLFWSPGTIKNPYHPGDDEKAKLIYENNLDVFDPQPTQSLMDLVSSFQTCKYLITTEGGASHIGALVGTRILTIFGDVSPEHWAPRTKNSVSLKNRNHNDVKSISVDHVMQAWDQLLRVKKPTTIFV